MKIRPATLNDAEGIRDILEDLVRANKRTNASDIEFVRRQYINNPDLIRCSLAVDDDGTALGFQVLLVASETNPYGTPVGWGIVGTHVSPTAARRGIGKALFDSTQQAAREAGLDELEAFIAKTNTEAVAYYEAIGFRTYRTTDVRDCKSFRV